MVTRSMWQTTCWLILASAVPATAQVAPAPVSAPTGGGCVQVAGPVPMVRCVKDDFDRIVREVVQRGADRDKCSVQKAQLGRELDAVSAQLDTSRRDTDACRTAFDAWKARPPVPAPVPVQRVVGGYSLGVLGTAAVAGSVALDGDASTRAALAGAGVTAVLGGLWLVLSR